MKEQLIARWDAFLDKMRTRFIEAMTYGEEAVLGSLEENDYDFYGSFRVLQGVRMQLYSDLVQKVTDTWKQQVEPLMRTDGHYWTDESDKGYRLTEWMNTEIEYWLYITEGKLSQKYYDHAIQLINRQFFCTQCNSPLEIKKDFFMAQYVTCNYCNTVNTFVPETKYTTIGWNVVNNIAALFALEEYRMMQEVRSQGGSVYEKAMRNYYEKYFDERIRLMPHTAVTRQQDIDSEIRKHFVN